MRKAEVIELSCRARSLLKLRNDSPLDRLDAVEIAQRLDSLGEFQEKDRPKLSRFERALRKMGLRRDPIQPFSPEVRADVKSSEQAGQVQITRRSFEAGVYAALEADVELTFKRNDIVEMAVRPMRAGGGAPDAALKNG